MYRSNRIGPARPISAAIVEAIVGGLGASIGRQGTWEDERSMSDEIRHAASVLAVREGSAGSGGQPQVLVLERGAASRFLPGYVVFPGGAVDAGDAALAARWFDDEAEAARAAAVRELVEEAGLALTRDGLVDAGDPDSLDPVHAAPPSADQLHQLARWVAPDEVPVRFDATYFTVTAPGDLEPAPDGGEAAFAWWTSPRGAACGVARRRPQALLAHLRDDARAREVRQCRIDRDAHVRHARARRRRGGAAPSLRLLGSVMLHVVRVLAPNPSPYTLEGTNTWIVSIGPPGPAPPGATTPPAGPVVVIDPGPDDASHLDELARAAGEHVSTVLVTHDHPDHAPGAAAFASRVGAPLLAFRLAGAEHLRDGQQVLAGDLRLIAVHTPGHTSDHMAFSVPSNGALFTGDAVLGRGTSFIDPPDGDLGQYLRSLARMRELTPRTIYPGHGPVVLDAGEKLREYVDHRAEREQQIIDAISGEPRTIADLVAEIYAAYPPQVHELAARSVLAHLLKLSAEGRAEQRGRGDDARWQSVAPRACDRCGKPVNGRGRYCGSCSLILLQEGSGA